MIDSTTIKNITDVITGLGNIITALLVVITGIGSFFVGHRRGTRSTIKRMNNGK